MARVCLHGSANGFGNLFPGRSFAQELDMFFPGKRYQHTHIGSSTAIQKPTWRRMINPHKIQTGLAHEREVKIHLLRPAKIVPLGIRLKRTVRNAFDEEFLIAIEKEFRSRTN